jgi:hypothetical protein
MAFAFELYFATLKDISILPAAFIQGVEIVPADLDDQIQSMPTSLYILLPVQPGDDI